MIKIINFINAGKTLVVTFLLAILSFSFISAFGVSTSYWEGNPLQISPGETTTVFLGVQNMVGDEDITVTTALLEGSEIASVPEKEYLIKAGTKDTQVPVTISIPLDVALDSQYTVKVSFLTVNDEGGIALGTGINSAFDVLIVGLPEEEKEGKNFILIAISLFLIIAILILIYIFRKKIFNKK